MFDVSAGIASGDNAFKVGDAIYTHTAGLRRYAAAGCGAPTCNPIWQTQPTGAGAINDLAAEPAGPLFALAVGPAFNELSLHTIDPVAGLSTGSIALGFAPTSLALDDGMVFVAGGTRVAAYDAAACAAGSCALRWSATMGGEVTFANGLAVAGGVVYAGRTDGVVEAFAESGCGTPTCSPVTSVSTTGPSSSWRWRRASCSWDRPTR